MCLLLCLFFSFAFVFDLLSVLRVSLFVFHSVLLVCLGFCLFVFVSVFEFVFGLVRDFLGLIVFLCVCLFLSLCSFLFGLWLVFVSVLVSYLAFLCVLRVSLSEFHSDLCNCSVFCLLVFEWVFEFGSSLYSAH